MPCHSLLMQLLLALHQAPNIDTTPVSIGIECYSFTTEVYIRRLRTANHFVECFLSTKQTIFKLNDEEIQDNLINSSSLHYFWQFLYKIIVIFNGIYSNNTWKMRISTRWLWLCEFSSERLAELGYCLALNHLHPKGNHPSKFKLIRISRFEE